MALLRIVERAPGEKGNPLVYGAIGLVVGIILSLGLAALTPAGVEGAAKAFWSVVSKPGFYRLALPYFVAISLSGLGLTVAYRARFITIGAEGQLILGMIASFWASYYLCAGLPASLTLLCSAVAAAAVGAAYSLVVGVLRVQLQVNETLSSLMLNYIAISLLNYLVSGPWSVGGFTKTASLPPEYTLSPEVAAAAALAAIVVVEAVYRYTRLGVAVDSTGLARLAAVTYGVDFKRTILLVSLISGALAGLGGMLYLVSGVQRLFSTSQGVCYGYIGILAAWLAGLRPLAVAASSMLLALLYVMNTGLQLSGVLVSFVQAMQAVIVITVTVFTALSRYRIVVVRRG